MPEPIPFDIVELIVEHIVSVQDTPTLKSCALVSHELCALSQKHLFQRVKISHVALLIPLYHLFIRSPHISLLIRELYLIIDVGYALEIASILLMVELRHLQLQSNFMAWNPTCWVWSDLPPNLLRAFTEVLRSKTLISLSLIDWKFHTDVELYDFLSNGVNVTNLEVNFGAGNCISTTQHTQRIHLKSLVCSSHSSLPGNRPAFNWLLSPYCLYSLDCLQSLHMPGFESEGFKLSDILKFSGQSLQQLGCQMTYEPLDLSSAVTLKEISFDLSRVFGVNGAIRWIVESLATMPSQNQLENISIKHCRLQERGLNGEDMTGPPFTRYWKNIEDSFLHPKFSCLKSVTLYFHSTSTMGPNIVERFQTLAQRGVRIEADVWLD